MKWFLFGLRLMAVGMVFFLMGCGGGQESDVDPGARLYKLRFKWHNTSSKPMRFTGIDVETDASESISVSPDVTDGTIVTSTYTSATTNIVAIAADGLGSDTRVTVNGVKVAENKTTYIYVTYDGTTLNVDATREPGVL